MPKTRLLLADDDTLLTSTLAPLLQTDGYEVEVAHSGCEALRLLEGNNFDLIVLDLFMPMGTGHDVAGAVMEARLRGEKWATNLQVVVLTAAIKQSPEDVPGIAAVVLKPTDYPELKRVIDGAVTAGAL